MKLFKKIMLQTEFSTKKLPFLIFSSAILCLSPLSGQAILVDYLPNYKITDNDLLARGNLPVVTQAQVDFQYQTVLTNGKMYQLGKFTKATDDLKNAKSTSVQYLVLHDSEDAAFDSGLQKIANDGGTLWVLENQENRNLYDFASQSLTHSDPNRMFWRLTAEDFPAADKAKLVESHSHSQSQNNEVKTNANAEFANYVLEQLGLKTGLSQPKSKKRQPNVKATLTKQPLLVALHNNRAKGNFGVDYIDEFGNTQVACSHDNENKNLFWLATTSDKKAKVSQNSEMLRDKLCATGTVNVVSETAPSVADGDGSLSVYMVNHFPAWQYVNIEIKAGKQGDKADESRAKNEQLRYLKTLETVLGSN